jgi:hypothetical protein
MTWLYNCLSLFLYFWTHIRWMCHSYRWWLQDILHNYEHVITQQLHRLWKVRSARSLSPWIVLMTCLCPRNAAAFLWRVAYPYWPMIHPRCFCVVNRDCVIIYHHVALDGNKLVQHDGGMKGLQNSYIYKMFDIYF